MAVRNGCEIRGIRCGVVRWMRGGGGGMWVWVCGAEYVHLRNGNVRQNAFFFTDRWPSPLFIAFQHTLGWDVEWT